MFKRRILPKESDFPLGTEFYIFEWDVPLSKEPDENGETVSYFNWFGSKRQAYPIDRLKIDNNWPADSFEHWLEIVKDSSK
ncbi:hypothetical protein ACROAE_09675 [Shewanella sp. MF05960]|uniref:hypothetical protein n=1 Tax=Shewanella sp. MF05960 TaxID=3434874 RepID=UPI003D7B2000